MTKPVESKNHTWVTIFLFLGLVFALTSPFHYAIVNLYPSRIYVGSIMWCPAIAAFITLKIRGLNCHRYIGNGDIGNIFAGLMLCLPYMV